METLSNAYYYYYYYIHHAAAAATAAAVSSSFWIHQCQTAFVFCMEHMKYKCFPISKMMPRWKHFVLLFRVLFFHSKTRSIITKGVLLKPVTRGILFIVRDLGRTLHNVVSLFALPLNIIFSTQWLWRHGLHSFRWMLHGCVTKIKCLIWNLLISVSDVVGKKLFE